MPVPDFGKRLVHEFMDDDLTGLAAELSYRFFLALFPFAIFLAALGGFVASLAGVENPAQKVIDLFGDALPSDAASVVRKQVEEVVSARNAGLLSFGILGTIWAAGGGVGALIKAMNRAYDIPETRPFWKKTGIALGITVLAGTALLAAFGVMIAFQAYGGRIADAIGLGTPFAIFMNVARFPLVLALLTVAIAFVYWAAPNTAQPFKWVTPGALVFTVGWIVATVLFALYVASFSSYNATYGALGGVVVLLVWFYLTSVLVLLGAEVNAVLDEAQAGEALAERRRLVNEDLQKRRKKDPYTPESTPLPAANAEAAPTRAGTTEPPPGHPGEARQPRRRAMQPTGPGPLVALAGLFVAAFALRRWAR
ncbi:MAG: YihY family inner membrane protein [Dehalococcoidia bacterium]|nr:YihY family inner membrane protein [Dehalococcoidia bacterium]